MGKKNKDALTKDTYKKFNTYESIMDPKSNPSYTTKKGKTFKPVSGSKHDKIEFFKLLGTVQTAGYKTRKPMMKEG